LPRILALDLGQKRTGVAVTDPLQIIATPLETVETKVLWAWLQAYLQKEAVEAVVVGLPINEAGEPSALHGQALQLMGRLRNAYPALLVEAEDERYTTRMATAAIRQAGLTKTARQNKALYDKVSASIILQSYLERRDGRG
jgi:putative Holliday junction resolvase